MPKVYRGGKGRTEKPLTEDERMYDVIGKTENGIAVIKAKNPETDSDLPLYSNSPDVVYFALDRKDGTRKSIGIYKDYQLVQSIDYKRNPKKGQKKNHFHDWGNPQIVRGKKSLTKFKGENENLTEEHKRLVKQFNEWWNKRG